MISSIYIIIREPTKELAGLRLVQPVKQEGFNSYIDIAHFFIEQFNADKITNSMELNTEDIDALKQALKEIEGDKRKRSRVVKETLVKD